MSGVDITVCIPAYNAEDSIERAIRSVTDHPPAASVEVLVCDDGSTDATAAIVRQLSTELDGVRLICNDGNRGRPFTRNHLLSEASGRFLTWLDADDEKYPGMLQAQLDRLADIEREGGEAALSGILVFTNFDWIRPEWERPRLICPPEAEDPMEALLDASFGGYLWLMMGLRSTFVDAGPFDTKLPRLQDLGFFIKFAELGGRFIRVESEEPLCVYYKDDSGRSAMDVWRSWGRIYKRYRHHYESYGMDNARRWRRHHYRVARRFARANGDDMAFAWIASLEILFIIHGRLRRVFFDA